MAQGILLTDDEVVALAALLGRPWPTGLATVATTAQELSQAGKRGVRSLIIRGIVTADAESGYTTHPGVSAVIETFVNASQRIGGYIARSAALETMAGASLTAVPVAGIWWIDAATAQGVHGFRQAEAEEVLAAIAELADHTRDGTLLSGVDDAAEYAFVIVYGDGPEQRIVVPANSSDGTAWDRGPLQQVFAAAAV
ncbi:hypothetical protein [Mycolicibacter kumamotonensis]|jgi:hypothetical protein|uniref:Uncharacterized protein n=1 Tax=Mycolicibacter kumamotonensis TaxID=354243 RepID=A0A1B8SB32_9MYCO|nr:hypothetical protein [Mycolicibacter kumamotonensis]NDJ91776.1 hypothetical protein [Mycolicibacter kumamotonensis]OBY29896.1 hypothetical protein ACT18_20485 [Mycolicibacter kumamotonensis]